MSNNVNKMAQFFGVFFFIFVFVFFLNKEKTLKTIV